MKKCGGIRIDPGLEIFQYFQLFSDLLRVDDHGGGKVDFAGFNEFLQLHQVVFAETGNSDQSDL